MVTRSVVPVEGWVVVCRGYCLLLLLAGCGGGEAVTALNEQPPDPPQEWREGGRMWRYTQEYGAADDALLEKFFRMQPDLAGSPDIAGEPLVFTSGAADRQYVWLRQAVDGTYWYCVRYAGGRFSVKSGQGLPWSSVTEPAGVG